MVVDNSCVEAYISYIICHVINLFFSISFYVCSRQQYYEQCHEKNLFFAYEQNKAQISCASTQADQLTCIMQASVAAKAGHKPQTGFLIAQLIS